MTFVRLKRFETTLGSQVSYTAFTDITSLFGKTNKSDLFEYVRYILNGETD